MERFSVPAAKPLSYLQVDRFLGCNFTDHSSNVEITMSPNAPNMIRDVPGKVRKCMGYECTAKYAARINGAHFYKGGGQPMIHAGTGLYQGETCLYSGMADARSLSWQFGDALYLLDGQNFLRFNGTTVQTVQSCASVPTVTIAKAPAGGGTALQPLNLLSAAFCEKFAGTATDKIYQLTFAPLDATEVKVQVQTAAGWQPLTEGTGFSVNRTSGTVTFVTAPGESLVRGEDNVSITASRTVEGYAERITHCLAGIPFGIGGAADRLFLGGAPERPNYDYFSASSDPTFFGDISYGILGRDDSTVMGYTVVQSQLATHMKGGEDSRNIVLWQGELREGETVFRVTALLQGPETAARGSFGYLTSEPVFLTPQGIYALTPADTTGERYAQNRSYYLNGRLCDEKHLEEAVSTVFRDMYWLCVNDRAYLLDGLQPLTLRQGMPYATRQYAGFYRTNLPARVIWQKEGRLWLGTADGRVCRFYDDPLALKSYTDDGAPIAARWELPDFSGQQFYRSKSVRALRLRLAAAPVTSLKVLAMQNGLWQAVANEDTKARYFDWRNLNWAKFTWSCDSTPRLISLRTSVKRTDKVRFAFENSAPNEPFGLFDIALEYRQGAVMR